MYCYCENNPCCYGDEYDQQSQCVVDVTEKLNNEMRNNYALMVEYAYTHLPHDTLLFFIDKVKTGGDWDFKNNHEWNLNDSDIYVYKGLVLRKDEIGNIHFGYVGAALFDLYTLKAGAGVYQIKSGTSQLRYFTSFFDDPVDAKAIEYGYRMSINENNRFEISPLNFIISFAFFFTFSHEHDHYTRE